MKAVARDDHDLVARRQVGPQNRPASGRDDADGAAGELDVLGGDEPRQGRRLAASPGGSGIDARLAPAFHQPGVPLFVGVPVGRSGCEIGVNHQRYRPHAAEVVDDRRHRVVRDVVERAHAELLLHLAGDDRLGAEAFDDERERLAAGLEYERRLAPRLVDGAPSGRGE